MKVVILAGGRGSRLSELTGDMPKPMVTVGGVPMIQHVMDIYASQGYSDFIVAGGYKMDCIGNWLSVAGLPYRVQLIDTGLNTQTGGRVAKLGRHLSERFFLTYGDGLANIDFTALMKMHDKHQGYCTVTAVQPPSKFGHLELSGDRVSSYNDKTCASLINGGFFVVEPEALDYIHGDEPWESGALARLTDNCLLYAYRHTGFWQCMDTTQERELLETLYLDGQPWRVR